MFKIGAFRVPYAFGWEPDPYSPFDLSFSDGPLYKPTSLADVDNTQFYKPISNQLHLPSCTANACVDFWEAVLVQQKVHLGTAVDAARQQTPELSRLFPWYFGRLYMDPPRHNDANSGCYNRLIMEVVARMGLPREDLWPYDPTLACIRPSISSQREAFQRRSKAFYKIREDGAKRIEMTCAALEQVPGVVFGTGLGQEFFGYRSGVLSPPNRVVGRHAMVVVGHSRTRKAFKVRNSWSRAWGEDGHCWLSYDYFLWSGSDSFWTAEAM